MSNLTKGEMNEIVKNADLKLQEFIRKGDYKALLNGVSNLSNYSFLNQMYLLLQMNTVSFVKGYKSWANENVHVKKGEKALSIFAPLGLSKRLIVDEDGKPILDENGNRQYETLGYAKAFKKIPVFDISQTDKEIKESSKLSSLPVEKMSEILEGLAEINLDMDVTVHFSDEFAIDFKTREINIKSNASDLEKIEYLIKATVEFKALESPKNFKGLTEDEVENIKEIEKQSIKYVIATHFELDMNEEYTFAKLAKLSDENISKFRRNLDIISKISTEIISTIEERM